MFAFGYALIPLYDVFCDVTGLNGKTGRVETEAALSSVVDEKRLVTVEFVSSVNADLPWKFAPTQARMQVHPGQVMATSFYAENLSDKSVTGQAIPSLAPGLAAKYFNKTECFCFTQQTLTAGQRVDMPLRFIVDPKLPQDVSTVTLSYTFFTAPDNSAGLN